MGRFLGALMLENKSAAGERRGGKGAAPTKERPKEKRQRREEKMKINNQRGEDKGERRWDRRGKLGESADGAGAGAGEDSAGALNGEEGKVYRRGPEADRKSNRSGRKCIEFI
jgi:hypothetical protein